MLDVKDNEAIGSEGMSRDELLAGCREIYLSGKEALGVLAIHLELMAGWRFDASHPTPDSPRAPSLGDPDLAPLGEGTRRG